MSTTFVPLSATGRVSPISLLEIQLISGVQLFLSERTVNNMPSVLSGPLYPTLYSGWIVGAPKFQQYGSTQTDTGSISVQNVSGNTVERDMSVALSKYEWIDAFIYYRLWDASSETALFTFMGNIKDAEISEDSVDFNLEGFGNWSAVRAPAYDIDVSCGLSFGSMQCGSTASTFCNQTYGACSSLERFQGVVVQYDSSSLSPSLVQIAQPAPAAAYNPARAF